MLFFENACSIPQAVLTLPDAYIGVVENPGSKQWWCESVSCQICWEELFWMNFPSLCFLLWRPGVLSFVRCKGMLIARPLIEVNPALFAPCHANKFELVTAAMSYLLFRPTAMGSTWEGFQVAARLPLFHFCYWQRLAYCRALSHSSPKDWTSLSFCACFACCLCRNIIVGVVVENTLLRPTLTMTCRAKRGTVIHSCFENPLLCHGTKSRINPCLCGSCWGQGDMFHPRLSVAKQNMDLQTKRAERQLFKEILMEFAWICCSYNCVKWVVQHGWRLSDDSVAFVLKGAGTSQNSLRGGWCRRWPGDHLATRHAPKGQWFQWPVLTRQLCEWDPVIKAKEARKWDHG